ncbi:MAG: hypothetical protein Q8S21_06605 [Candidatus Paracaedibacteraceae bacterium]|nr:hypothetical protein [Candidatus Paracaedibacteraceae bacterium]
MIKFLLVFYFFFSASYAIVPDTIHNHDDYVELSFEAPEFNAACAVIDSKAGVTMTGVLVAPNIVLTAAHGIEAIVNKLNPTETKHGIMAMPITTINVYFKGRNQTRMGQASHVLMDPRYFEKANKRQGKFDFAFLRLVTPIEGITPAVLFQKAIIPSNALMTVVTYGTADLKPSVFSWGGIPVTRRAFRLYERDTYFSRSDDAEEIKSSRYLQESSVFFKILKRAIKPEPTDPEEIIRSYEATQNWHADGSKPFGLALPGTSGSPVFIRLIENGKKVDYLFGLVSSFSHLTGQFRKRGHSEMDYILSDVKNCMGGYQTIYSLFYRTDTFEKSAPNTAIYSQDPQFKMLMKTVNEES